MPGSGTLVNVMAVLLAGIAGTFGGHLFPKRFQKSLMVTCRISVILLGIASALSYMLVIQDTRLSVQGSMMMILSLALGALVGEAIDLEKKLETFAQWLKEKSGNRNDSRFIEGFMNASLTICVGAIAIVGSIQDGLLHQPQTLYAKAILDFIIILVMSASLGKGCLFSAIPVFLLQGSMTALASLLEPFFTPAAMVNLNIVGNVLITCVGINLLFPKTIRVANLLPGLLIAIGFSYLHLPFLM